MRRFFREDELRVLILAPTGEDTTALCELLEADGMRLSLCTRLEELTAGIEEGAGAAILADEVLTDETIALLSHALAGQPEWSDFPLIVITPRDKDEFWLWTSVAENVASVNVTPIERPVYARSLLAAVRSALRSRIRQYRTREELRLRREAEESLRAANRELDAFTHSVSHDLINPLNSIQAMADILRDFYASALDDDGKRCIEEIAKSRRKMTDLIRDLLRLSRLSRQELEPRKVDVTAVVREVLAELRQAQPHRTVRTNVEEGMTVRADPGLFKVVVTNLVGNAWKYTESRPDAEVAVGVKIQGNERCFFVRDNGVGFDMRLAERLFLPFQRLHSEREFSGVGVGLSIVKRIVDRHGGRVWAESSVGQGATFYIVLPEN